METGNPGQESDKRKTSELGTAHDWLSRVLQPGDVPGSAERIDEAEDMLRTRFRTIEQAADLVVITDTAAPSSM